MKCLFGVQEKITCYFDWHPRIEIIIRSAKTGTDIFGVLHISHAWFRWASECKCFLSLQSTEAVYDSRRAWLVFGGRWTWACPFEMCRVQTVFFFHICQAPHSKSNGTIGRLAAIWYPIGSLHLYVAAGTPICRVGQNRIYTYIYTVYLVISKPKN